MYKPLFVLIELNLIIIFDSGVGVMPRKRKPFSNYFLHTLESSA